MIAGRTGREREAETGVTFRHELQPAALLLVHEATEAAVAHLRATPQQLGGRDRIHEFLSVRLVEHAARNLIELQFCQFWQLVEFIRNISKFKFGTLS